MKKLLGIIVLGLLLSSNAYAKKYAEVIFQNDQSIVFKSKRGLFADSSEKWNRKVNQIMSISKMHCNRINKDAYWFRGLTSGQGDYKAGVDAMDSDQRKTTYAMFRVICASSVNEAIINFRQKISMYNSELSKRPNSVYKNDISNWYSDIKLKSSDFNVAKDNSNISSTNISFNIKQKKEQCTAIGFKPETEKFADCVLRLVELDIKQQQSNKIATAQNSGNDALVKQLQRQQYDRGTDALLNLGQQLLNPGTTNSNVYMPQTQRCTIQGFGTFAKMVCR